MPPLAAILKMPANTLCFMGRADDLHKTALTPQKTEVTLVFTADPMSVRRALKASTTALCHLQLTQDQKGIVEIVLAEVLNNIVEHSYADQHQGVIELAIQRRNENLVFIVMDDGIPLPNHIPKPRKPHNLSCPVKDLPEGGFGWALIKDLTQKVDYHRSGTRNRIEFTIALKNTSRS